MLLSLGLSIINQSGIDWEINIPCDITSRLGLDKEHPSLYAYSNILPDKEQIFVSPILLSEKIFILTIILKDVKASCDKVLEYLKNKKIQILRTDELSLQHSVSWEAIVSLEQNISLEKAKEMEDEIKRKCNTVIDIWIRPIMNKLPKNETFNCIIDFKKPNDIKLSSYGQVSCIKISISDLKKLLHNKQIQKRKAVIGIYSQIPLMVINFFKPDAKLVDFSYELPHELGSLHDTIKPLTNICSIIGLNATTASKKPSRDYGICSGIFHIHKDKNYYDLTDLLEKMGGPGFKLIRDPLRLGWSPEDYDTFLYLIKKTYNATWDKQTIGKEHFDDDMFKRAIVLDGFKSSDINTLNVAFTFSKQHKMKGPYDFKVIVTGTPKDLVEDDLEKFEQLLNQKMIEKKSDFVNRLDKDVDWYRYFR